MKRILMGTLGVAGLLAALAAPAAAQEEGKDWIWKTDGKRWTRTEGVVKPFVMPTTMTSDVARGEKGDSWRMKYTGKSMQRVETREVQRPASEVVQGHERSWRLSYVGKTTTRENYCVENGVEHASHDMNQPGTHTAY